MDMSFTYFRQPWHPTWLLQHWNCSHDQAMGSSRLAWALERTARWCHCCDRKAIAHKLIWKTWASMKIMFYIVINFFYKKANILRRWSNILHRFYWNKGLCHWQWYRSHWFRGRLELLNAAFEQLQNKTICCVSMQDSRGCSVYEHTAIHIFFSTAKIAPAGLLKDLVTIDADWHSPKLQTQVHNWLRQQPHSTLSTQLYTAYK